MLYFWSISVQPPQKKAWEVLWFFVSLHCAHIEDGSKKLKDHFRSRIFWRRSNIRLSGCGGSWKRQGWEGIKFLYIYMSDISSRSDKAKKIRIVLNPTATADAYPCKRRFQWDDWQTVSETCDCGFSFSYCFTNTTGHFTVPHLKTTVFETLMSF